MTELPSPRRTNLPVFPDRVAIVAIILAVAGSWIFVAARGNGGPARSGLPFGPLGTPNGQMESCSPTKTHFAYNGEIPLQNDPGVDITLDSIRLINPDGLRLVTAYVLPIYHTNLLGNAPPKETNPAWRARERLQGAVIAGGDERNLFLVLSIAGRKTTGTATDTEIRYHDARGRRYRFLTTEAIRIVRDSCDRYPSVVFPSP